MDKLVGITSRILARHKIACVVSAQLFYGRVFLYIKKGLDRVCQARK